MVRTIHFITLMKDDQKYDRNLDEIERIIHRILEKVKKDNPRNSFKAKLLYGISPDADDMRIFKQSIDRGASGAGLEIAPLIVKQVLLDEGHLEQERFLPENDRSLIKEAWLENNKIFRQVESDIQGIYRDPNFAIQDQNFIHRAQDLLKKNRDLLRGIDGTAAGAVRESIKETLDVLDRSNAENEPTPEEMKGSIRKTLDVLQDVVPLTLDKKDAEAYKTELTLRGNEKALSNILTSSMAKKYPGDYINLDAFHLDETDKIVNRIVKDADAGIDFNSGGNIMYIRSSEMNREQLRMINHERNQRYELLANRVPNLQPIKDQINFLKIHIKSAGSGEALKIQEELQVLSKELEKEELKSRGLLHKEELSPSGRKIIKVADDDLLEKRLGISFKKRMMLESQNPIIDIYNRGQLTTNLTGKGLVEDIESLQKPQKLNLFERIKEIFKSLFGIKNEVSNPRKLQLIAYSRSDRKSKSKAEKLYKKDPKNSMLYSYDSITDKLIFIKAGGVKNERQLQFKALYKNAGFDSYVYYGEKLINPNKAAKLLSERGIPLRNNRLTPLERKAVEKVKKHITDEIGILYSLPNALEELKKNKDYEGVDYKKIARHFLEEKGGMLMMNYKNKAGNHSINGKDEFGNVPLLTVAGSKELVEILVEDYRADVNMKNNQGFSAAFLAASLGKLDNIKYLQQNGADLYTKDYEGGNILYGLMKDHVPTSNRDLINTFRYLVEQGVDPNEKNASGKSVKDLAIETGKYDLVELFEPLNLSAAIYNALPPDTKKFMKDAIKESIESENQVSKNVNLDTISEDIEEPSYAVIEGQGLPPESISKAEKQLSKSYENPSDEPIYVDPSEIRLNKEFNRLAKIEISKSSSIKPNPIDSGYTSNIDKNLILSDVPADGNCGLHAIASAYLIPVVNDDQKFGERFQKLFGDDKNVQEIKYLIKSYDPKKSKDNILYHNPLWHDRVDSFRQQLVDHMSKESCRSKYELSFVSNDPEDHNVESFDDYLAKMRKSGVYVGDREISAVSDLLNYPIKVDKQPDVYNAELGEIPLQLHHVKFGSSGEHNHYNFSLYRESNKLKRFKTLKISSSSLLYRKNRKSRKRHHTISN